MKITVYRGYEGTSDNGFRPRTKSEIDIVQTIQSEPDINPHGLHYKLLWVSPEERHAREVVKARFLARLGIDDSFRRQVASREIVPAIAVYSLEGYDGLFNVVDGHIVPNDGQVSKEMVLQNASEQQVSYMTAAQESLQELLDTTLDPDTISRAIRPLEQRALGENASASERVKRIEAKGLKGIFTEYLIMSMVDEAEALDLLAKGIKSHTLISHCMNLSYEKHT